jgi:hypothetical protein
MMTVLTLLLVVILLLQNVSSQLPSLSSFFMSSNIKCPSSPASMHAGCEVTITFDNTCDAVYNEMMSRVNDQYNNWHDPHNNGTYIITESSSKEISLDRKTGDGSGYTDKVLYTLTPSSTNGCDVTGCSESQVFSIGDYGTNYCNVRNLYAAPFVSTTLTYTESVLKCTQSTPSACSTV